MRGSGEVGGVGMMRGRLGDVSLLYFFGGSFLIPPSRPLLLCAWVWTGLREDWLGYHSDSTLSILTTEDKEVKHINYEESKRKSTTRRERRFGLHFACLKGHSNSSSETFPCPSSSSASILPIHSCCPSPPHSSCLAFVSTLIIRAQSSRSNRPIQTFTSEENPTEWRDTRAGG
jgi:hypothetical protein